MIDSSRRAAAPLPVLSRQPGASSDLTPPVPTLTAWSLASGAPAAHLGDIITVTGYHLDGANVTAYFSTSLSPTPTKVTAEAGASAFEARFRIPSGAPADWPAGPWQLAISPEGDAEGITNQLAFQLAPQITNISPNPATSDPSGDVTLSVDFAASVWPEQQVSLIVGNRLVRAPARANKVTQVAFLVRQAPLGDQFVRVRVDGVDSLLIQYPDLAFDTSQQVKIQ
jgi:hypothetical protein